MPDTPAPDARVCFNCDHMLWLVDAGKGLRCKHKSNEDADGAFMEVPSADHACELFEPATDSRRRGWCGY